MAEDREVMRGVWDGKLPICIHLAPEDVVTGQPEPFYLMVPRLSYLPLLLDKVRRHFMRSVGKEEQDQEMWLDYNGMPLKWHYPMGLLRDLYASDDDLPWSLTAHFTKFPENEILRCPSRDAVESAFMSTLKEADALKHKGAVISGMQKKDHAQLWMGLQNDKFDQFWSVNRKLMEAGSDECFRYIPFRLYIQDEPGYIQRLFRPINPEGKVMTLRDLLQQFCASSVESKGRVLLHGVNPPLDTPLQWLSEHMSYPDNFLHICILNS